MIRKGREVKKRRNKKGGKKEENTREDERKEEKKEKRTAVRRRLKDELTLLFSPSISNAEKISQLSQIFISFPCPHQSERNTCDPFININKSVCFVFTSYRIK